MPPPRGGGDIPGKERSLLSKAKRRGDAIEFKEEDFAKWVTGAHKRKVERQRTGHKEAEQKVRMSKNAEKREEREKMRQLVKQHFGDIQIDKDGRVLTSNYQRPAHLNEDDGYSSEEEYLIRKQQEHETAERKRLFKESQELQKKLPKWAKGKEEFLKDDSIIKEQNESFLTAQYSFNTEDNLQDIASKASKNKLLKNLEEEREHERETLLNESTKSNIMNFENDDSMVTVETSAMNIDASSIVSRRAQRDLTLLSSNTTSIQDLIGKRRAAARAQSKQHHTMDTSSTSSSDDSDDEKPQRSTRQQSNKKQPPKKTNHKKEKKIKPRPARSRLGLLRGNDEEVDNDAIDSDTTDEVSSDFDEEEEEQQVVTVVAPKPSKPLPKLTPKPQPKPTEVKAPPTKPQPKTIAPIIAIDSTPILTANDDDQEEEEWQVVEEEVINHAISSSDDDDKIFKRRELTRIAEEKKSLKKTQLELDRREKDFQASKLAKEQDKSKNKKQRIGALDSEFNATVQLAHQMADEIIQLDIDVTKQAKIVSMADASAWFMLPKPEAWDEADDRKKRLLEQRIQLQLKAAATSQESNKTDTKPGSKLTNLEVMELDPTYGWDEGESSNDRDLGAILGIPAASMGGRFRKKPLSEKNKYRSSDARKAKKQEKTREKEKMAAMAFESGFADMNTKGRGDNIKWDSDDETHGKAKGRKREEGGIFDDFGKESYYLDKTGAKKQRQAGDRVPEGGVNRKDRKRQEIKDQRRLEGAHKRGKMIRGKYFFGAKAGAVTL